MQEEIKTNLSEKELRENLRNKITKFRNTWNKVLTKEEKELLEEFTSFLPKDTQIVERKYYFMNNLTEVPKCPVCGKGVHYSRCSHKLRMFCSKECEKSKEGKEILNERQRERWRNMSEEERNRISEMRKEIYNNMSEEKKKEISEMRKEIASKRTTEEKQEIERKRRETCFKFYNASNPMKSDKVKNLRIENSLEKSGVKYSSQRESVKQKMAERRKSRTKKERDLIKENQSKAWIESLGVDHPSKSKKCKEKWLISCRLSYFNTFVENVKKKDLEPLFLIDDYVNARHGDILKFKCLRCGREVNYTVKKGNKVNVCDIRCLNPIHRLKFHSSQEQEIYEWLCTSGCSGDIEQNKRIYANNKRYEADLYLPDYKLAVEYNGLYWHSNIYRDKNYHYNKWKFFKEQGIDCIQIFEDEWLHKKEIVKNIILDRLNLLKNTGEKDYYVCSVNDEEFISFIDKNSLFAFKNCENKIGLYNVSNKELIQVLSYSISNDRFIINNFCTKIGYKFKEGLKINVDHLKQTYNKNIYIEIDCRYFSRNDFKDFEFVEHTEPKCYYFIGNENILYENKVNDDCLSIYDCGNDILLYKY